jgi:MFS family permease
VSAGGAGGALLAAPLSDFFGRKYALGIMGWVFMVGAALQEVPILEAMYAGRFLAGLAIGSTSMVRGADPCKRALDSLLTSDVSYQLAPQYLAENSPKSVRGSLTTSYNLMIIMALALAFWINYGVSLWPTEKFQSNMSWQLSLGIQLIPGGFMACMIWCKESPNKLPMNRKNKS